MMSVEPTQAYGPSPDDRSLPVETIAEGTIRRPEPRDNVPTEGLGEDEPTGHQPSGESLTDVAPPTVESFVKPRDPGATVPHGRGGSDDAQETVNLPTDDDWTPNGLAQTGGRVSGRQGSGASYDTVEASGQFYEGQLVFNRYIVQKEVGRGGMGAVWLVKHKELNADRALKVIVARISYDAQARSRFRLEAQVMASFHHPNAVVVHDARLTENDVAYIDMEYVQGKSLAESLVKGVPMPLEWIARILDQLCDVLEVAHKKKIVHRDLKPANLMLLDGYEPGREHLKVLDFGIAKILSDAEDTAAGPKTQTGVFLGTPFYASPEQADGHADTRSDIYAVGVILYEFLTGFRPFSGPAARVLVDVMTQPPPAFIDVNPEVDYPPEVEALVMRCLAKKPEDRPQTAREVADAFRAVALPGSQIDRPYKPEWDLSPPAPWLARHVKSIVAVCALVAAIAIVGWSLRPRPVSTSTGLTNKPTAVNLIPTGFAAAPKADLDEIGRPIVLVPTGLAEPLGMRFILLTGRKFSMGDPSDAKTNPHEETVGDFAISETEVTNGQMKAYFQANAVAAPKGFQDAIAALKKLEITDAEIDQHPAVGVPREMALKFAAWVAAEFPTSSQWEYAVRSGALSDRFYVWPDTIPPKKRLKANEGDVNLDNLDGRNTPTSPVRGYPKDKTDQGVFDMMGNVREWCLDADKTRPGYFVVRGGSFSSQAYEYSNFRSEFLSGAEVLNDLGFRLVVAMPPAPVAAK